jgi:hypothetical protein
MHPTTFSKCTKIEVNYFLLLTFLSCLSLSVLEINGPVSSRTFMYRNLFIPWTNIAHDVFPSYSDCITGLLVTCYYVVTLPIVHMLHYHHHHVFHECVYTPRTTIIVFDTVICVPYSAYDISVPWY